MRHACQSAVLLLALGLSATAAETPPAPASGTAAVAQPPALLDLAGPTVLARVRPAGQEAAAPRIVTNADGSRGLEFSCQAGVAWPGIDLLPETGAWDLSASAGVEVVVANVGSSPTFVGVRIDQVGGSGDQWNGEGANLAPGSTTTVRVRFGTSWGKPASKLDAARISQIKVYATKPGEGCVLRIGSCAVFGKAGEQPVAGPPKPIITHRPPGDPQVLSFSAGVDAARFRLTGAQVAAATVDGAAVGRITVAAPAAQAVVQFRPAQSRDLRDFSQATFTVRNAGTTAVRVACRLDGVQPDDHVGAEAELAPGQKREIVVPFAAASVWQGVTPAAATTAPGKPFLGAPTEQSSVGLVSDAVTAATLTILAPSATTVVEWLGVTAAVGAPAVLPEWIGTRPPVPGDWVAVYGDEFNGAALDETHWTPRLPWIGPIPWELQRYNDKNVTVHDGHLTIHCEKQTGHLYDNPAWPARDYTTGAVTTYDKWSMHYGYVEARMKLPHALGLWPAFWTMPDRGAQVDGKPLTKGERRSTGDNGMEFDIMEHVCRFGPFRYNIAGHWDGYGPDHRSVGTSRIYSQPDAEGYIIAGLLWEPGRLTWFCNGRPVGTWSDPRVGSVPASLKFTVQMGGWAGNEVDDSALPADFKIDWVRVWQLRDRLPATQPARP